MIKRKTPYQESEWVDTSDLGEVINECDSLQEKDSCSFINNENVVHKDEKVNVQEENKEEQISIEQNKKFSLKEAVIYSVILERPYK